MRWKRFSVGAFVFALCVGGLRIGARVFFRPQDSTHSSAHPCGALVWRTTTVTRKSRFDPMPVLVRDESTVELDGKVLVSDVGEFKCVVRGRPISMMAAVVRRPEGERANVSIFDASGALARVVHFAHDVEATSWPRDSDAFAAIGPKGEISVASLLEPESTKPVALSHEQALLGRVTWSPDGTRLCFVTGTRPGAQPGSAELFCSLVPAAPTSVARAAWVGSDISVPWVGFDARQPKPHLCGDDLQPRDVGCLGITRPSD